MRYKQILLSVFVLFIFNLFIPNSLPKSTPAPTGGPVLPGLYAQDVDLVKLKKEEEERKKKTKKSTRVVTNESIDKAAPPKKQSGVIKLEGNVVSEAAATTGGVTGDQVTTGVDDNVGTGTEAEDATRMPGQNARDYWQERAKKLDDDLEQTQTDIQNSEQELLRVNDEYQSEDIYEKRLALEKKND